MPNTTKYYVVQCRSHASMYGGVLNLGFGLSPDEAWENAMGPRWRESKLRKRRWCNEVDAEFYGSRGCAGHYVYED
jgi:hypothetical protein